MMDRAWREILRRYGTPVTVTTGGETRSARAFIQSVLDREEQLVPSPLGLRREERWLYLGPGQVELHPRESVVRWQDMEFEVISTRVVGDGHHVWGILRKKEGMA